MRISDGIFYLIFHLKNCLLLYKPGRHSDDWGTGWYVTVEGRCGIPVVYPIKPDLSDYSSFKWPEIFSAGVPKYRLYSGHMSGKSDEYYARGAWIIFFEQMQQLVGFENLLVALDSSDTRSLPSCATIFLNLTLPGSINGSKMITRVFILLMTGEARITC